MLLCSWGREPLAHYRGENSATIREISVQVPQRARNIYPVIQQKDLSRAVPAAGFTGGRRRLNRESAALPTESPWAFSRLARAAGPGAPQESMPPSDAEMFTLQGWSGRLFSLENLLSGLSTGQSNPECPLLLLTTEF